MSEFAAIHDELRAVARELLGAATPLTGDGGAPPAVDWSSMAELGWLGLEVPEALGGAGATFAEVAVILEELGRAAAVSPVLGTVVLGVGALNRIEPGPVRDELLGAIAAGATRVGSVLADGAGDLPAGPPFSITATADGPRLDGSARLVVDVPGADQLLLLAAGAEGDPVLVRLAPDDPGIEVGVQPVLDETRSFGSVVATGAPVAEGSVLRFADDPAGAAQALLDRGAVAVALDAVGLGRAMLDATVAYATVRQQFGRPIGSFQAVKHACADMLVHLTVAEELVRTAVADIATGPPAAAAASVSASMAKAYAGQAAVEVAGKAMQLHGGIGYAWESGVHVYLKRATLDRALLGSPARHRRRLADRLAARGSRGYTHL